ncbi:MAG: hypothetical protein ACU0CO_06225 [Shimia sp.]
MSRPRARLMAGLTEVYWGLGPVLGLAALLGYLGTPIGAAFGWASGTMLLLWPLVGLGAVALGRAPAPALPREGYALVGRGCLMCREMRRTWPWAVAPGALVAAHWTGIGADIAWAGLAAAPQSLAYASALRRDAEPHWDRATGFVVVPRRVA